MNVDDAGDPAFVGDLFNDLAIEAEAVSILLDLISESESVPDRLMIAFSTMATMVDTLSNKAMSNAELMRSYSLQQLEAGQSQHETGVGPNVGTVIPFS